MKGQTWRKGDRPYFCWQRQYDTIQRSDQIYGYFHAVITHTLHNIVSYHGLRESWEGEKREWAN